MRFEPGTVFVLGAGFTKGFWSQAPLIKDDYGTSELLKKISKAHPFAAELLKLEHKACGPKKVDLERLMTRLDGRMPYDRRQGAEADYLWLLSQVKRLFLCRLNKAMPDDLGHHRNPPIEHYEDLKIFATKCVFNNSACITFNYDCLLDLVLSRAGHGAVHLSSPNVTGWHPDSGYGFPCHGSDSLFCGASRDTYISRIKLLKLHGSLNWRVRLGQSLRYSPENIIHYESWSKCIGNQVPSCDAEHESLLDPDPFIVPPVLAKSALVEHPLLSVIWSAAFKVLSEAERVVFVGYSMPPTDIASGFLFRESLGHLDHETKISVVGLAKSEKSAEARRVISAYKKVFPKIAKAQFDWRGVRGWLNNDPPRAEV